MQLDIVDFYPSISKSLFNKALDFAKNLTTITEDEEKTGLDIGEHGMEAYPDFASAGN